MTKTNSAIAPYKKIIEGELVSEENQEHLSQHQTDLFKEDECEFSSDGEIIADFLNSKAIKTATTYWSTINQFQSFSGKAAIALWTNGT